MTVILLLACLFFCCLIVLWAGFHKWVLASENRLLLKPGHGVLGVVSVNVILAYLFFCCLIVPCAGTQ